MLIKFDLEKAYDRLSWDFIEYTLERVGLPDSWVRNIMQCVRTVRMTIYWNQKTLDLFKMTRGIRQGDPMSPYIFVICMERLGHAINEVVRQGG